ncbi:MAG: 30S ribosomal protein S7 [Flavobacteriales bacterium]|jgi:small subunit ribosomal protein S7|nr:30S ribosomal protein S7 [Bacteroidota bacterium]
MRKSKPKKRIILPDPKFKDTLVTKFVNNLMLSGKKQTSYEIFYESIEIISKRMADEPSPLDVWKKALENVTPAVEVRSRRVGGATFQIPQEIRPSRRLSLGMKWMILAARKRNDKSMAQKLANEVMAAFNNEGGAYKKKEDTHRMAEANKAFSHFRF